MAQDRLQKLEVKKCLAAIVGADPEARPAAIERLRELDIDPIKLLHERLDRELTQWDAARSVRVIGVGIFVLTQCMIFVSSHFKSGLATVMHLTMMAFGASIVTFTLMTHMLRPTPNCEATLAAIADQSDMRSIGRLFKSLGRTSKNVRPSVRAAILQLLGKICAADTGELTYQERIQLYKQLYSDDAELIVAILNAMPAFEDGSALPYVQRLAAGAALAATDNPVRAAAQAILPDVRRYAERSSGTATLLRPRQSQSDLAKVSLRAVQGSTEITSQQELLRSVMDGEQTR
jgi:hypothetical protein